VIRDAESAFRRAWQFVIYGMPYGDLDSFEAVEATYDEERNLWVVTCNFKKKGVPKQAKLEIDKLTGSIKGYKLLLTKEG